MPVTSPRDELRYPGQPGDEITQRVVYKHIMAIAPILFALIVVLFVALIGMVFYNLYQGEVEKYVPTLFASLVGFGILVVLTFLGIGTIWIWRRNKVVVTNQHIVDIDQLGLFNRTVSTLRLEEIQDISASVKGPIQTFFQYGTIIVQTAGERENFVFDYVPNPYELEHYILEIRKKYYEPPTNPVDNV
jgi:membrane protein YdbS with pleckstrin-like domain